MPTPEELLKIAKASLRQIRRTPREPILYNLIRDERYVGREYFDKIPKHTSVGNVKNPNDFSGIYGFYDEADNPLYVGISNTVIRRLAYHLTRNNHNESSLVYLIARDMYNKTHDEPYNGPRPNFPFNQYRQTIQNDMYNNWRFFYYPLSGGYELAFTEIYLAAALNTRWNSFGPH